MGVVHVHHAPSHDSDAPFSEVIAAAHQVGLDFIVLVEHSDFERDSPLLGAERAGVHVDASGHRTLVLVGAEFGTTDGHLLGYDIPVAYAAVERTGRELIERIHADGGFAVVPHPFAYGGWHDWEAPFDGIEVQNNAASFRRGLGPLLPLRLMRLAVDRDGLERSMIVRQDRALAQWETLLQSGRPVVGLAGADVHRNVSLLGWRFDPYDRMYRLVQTLCPEGPLEAEHVWKALRSGRCTIRFALNADRADEAREVRFPSGHVELQLDGGERLLEIRGPATLPSGERTSTAGSPGARAIIAP